MGNTVPNNDAMLEIAKKEYDDAGWYRSAQQLGADVLDKVRNVIEKISQENRPEVVHEKGTNIVRAVHGCHLYNETSANLVRLPIFVELAEALVGDQVYVYQFKVNLKQPHEGAAWPWHQDYTFWKNEDGMTEDRAVNIAILLDDTHEGNGPLQVLPGTHRLGLVQSTGGADAGSGNWRKHVSADLEYTVPDDEAERLEKDHGRELITGPAGTIYAFHPSIVHSSSSNKSPDRRALLLITYNAVSNATHSSPRPEFLVGTDTRPITAADDNRL